MADVSVKVDSGAAVSDLIAARSDSLTQAAWLAGQKISVSDRIRFTRVSQVRYQHPDLNEIHKFLTSTSTMNLPTSHAC